MKSKILLPLLAVVFALAGAFASSPVAQMGWFDSNGPAEGGGVHYEISIPDDDRTCSTSATTSVCKIVIGSTEFNAFDTKANAEANGGLGTVGLLRYD